MSQRKSLRRYMGEYAVAPHRHEQPTPEPKRQLHRQARRKNLWRVRTKCCLRTQAKTKQIFGSHIHLTHRAAQKNRRSMPFSPLRDNNSVSEVLNLNCWPRGTALGNSPLLQLRKVQPTAGIDWLPRDLRPSAAPSHSTPQPLNANSTAQPQTPSRPLSRGGAEQTELADNRPAQRRLPHPARPSPAHRIPAQARRSRNRRRTRRKRQNPPAPRRSARRSLRPEYAARRNAHEP